MIKKNAITLKLTAALLAIALSSAFFTVSAGVEYSEAGIQSYEDMIAATEQKRAEAEDVLIEIQRDQVKTFDQIAQYDKILELNEELRRLTAEQIDALGVQMEQTKQSIADTGLRIEKQKEALLDRMREAYMDNTTDYLELLLSSTSLFDFLKKLDYVDAVLNYDQDLIVQMGQEQERLREYEQLLAATEEEQKLRLADLDERIAEYTAAEEEKYEYILSLQENEQLWTENYSYNTYLIETLNRELEDYTYHLEEQRQREAEAEAERIRLEQEQARMEAEQARREEEQIRQEEAEARQESERELQLERQKEENARQYDAYNKYYGSLTECWPLESGVKYKVTSEQGWRILFGVSDYHYGIDLACARGTEIYAFNGGTVIKSESHRSYGNYVMISHGGGISTLYAHMSNRLVNVGDRIEPGQQVGNVGLTGNTTGYHLHFEVRENGKVVNPRNYLVFP